MANISGGSVFYGIDVGSTTAKLIVVNDRDEVIHQERQRTFGRPVETVMALISSLPRPLTPEPGKALFAMTGTGGRLIQSIIGGVFVNEVVAHTEAALFYHPEVRTILDMGGQDTKLIILEDGPEGKCRIKDFQLNTACAAGTGSFLDQQATRLGLSISEFSDLSQRSRSPATIAGRCTVFAKSDMIHLAQNAVPVHDIAAGLAFALVRNIKATLAKGRPLPNPFCFQGGVAENLGVRRALKEVFKIPDEKLYIPELFKVMGAIGAVIYARGKGLECEPFRGIKALQAYMAKNQPATRRLAPLGGPDGKARGQDVSSQKGRPSPPVSHVKGRKEVLIGVDVGSISTKVVALDREGRLLATYYGRTAGRPMDAIRAGLKEIRDELGADCLVLAAGTTGSGRYLAGDFIGADIVVNEITAQARAAVFLDPEVDTIFEIGGQDSKYIRIEEGTVVDFMMNRACAAGTGSFLEEQAGRLGLPIEEFGRVALKAPAPVEMGERCTVFMESDLVHYLQQGVATQDLVAGLCYAIVHNYLNKVVEHRPIGRRIFFQGATALNQGIVAAFEKVLGRPVNVPEYCNVTGAVGAALLAKERGGARESRFHGFDEIDRAYEISSFECRSCENLCSVSKVKIQGRSPIFYGGRCERYERGSTSRDTHAKELDLVSRRQEMLLGYTMTVEEARRTKRGEIGIPFALLQQELLPFFATFLRHLGFGPVASGRTTKAIYMKGVETSVVEPCFPVKAALGHLIVLGEMGIERVFLPSVIDFPGLGSAEVGQTCPYCQSFPYMCEAVPSLSSGIEIIRDTFRMGTLGIGDSGLVKRLSKRLGVPKKAVLDGLMAGKEAQEAFDSEMKGLFEDVLKGPGKAIKKVLLVGRPYNALDPGLNLGLSRKLISLGALPLPMDALPLERYADFGTNMYWRYGQKILAAARALRDFPEVSPVYITNFGCGPDSFVLRQFKEALEDRPFLEIEIDEHTQDAGLLTRIEAFLDTRERPLEKVKAFEVGGVGFRPVRQNTAPPSVSLLDRTVYIPSMSNHAHVLAAAMRAYGLDARVLPETDHESVRLGMKHTIGKECYPAVLTTGDMLKMTMMPGFDPRRSAFFMPCGQGPCRFGQYPQLHRSVLDGLGLSDVPIFGVDQDEGMYEEIKDIGKGFDRLVWQGVVAVDLLEAALRATRPYEEEDRGRAQRVFEAHLKRLLAGIEEKGPIQSCLKGAARDFARLLPDPSKKKRRPRVGIVGEIYVRSNDFANSRLVRTLEGFGAEVVLPTVGEWLLYTNFTAMRRARRRGETRRFMGLYARNLVQILDLRRFERIFKGIVPHEPLTTSILKWARPHLTDEFEGEAILSVGKAVHLIEQGIGGIVSVMPFTCMPGTIVLAMLQCLRQRLADVPVLGVSCDFQQSTARTLRLEAFMHQVQSSQRAWV